jgi:hypothetical protein
MNTLIVSFKNSAEAKFTKELLNRLGNSSSILTDEELENLVLSKMMMKAEKSGHVKTDTFKEKLAKQIEQC